MTAYIVRYKCRGKDCPRYVSGVFLDVQKQELMKQTLHLRCSGCGFENAPRGNEVEFYSEAALRKVYRTTAALREFIVSMCPDRAAEACRALGIPESE
jgi:hypothetical protein